MALLEELNSAPGADKFPAMYNKLNELIQAFNAVLGGGTAEQGIKKSDSTDFNYEFYNVPELNSAFSAIALTVGAFNGNGLGYRKQPDGYVQLKGSFLVAYNDTSVLFTLPSGFNPPRTMKFFGGTSLTAYGRYAFWIEINTSGECKILEPSIIYSGNLLVHLDGISFYKG